MTSARKVCFLLAVVFVAALALTASGQGIGAGRYQKTDNPFTVSLEAGYVGFDEGEVRETRRAYDTSQGEPDYKAFLSAYTLDDLNFAGRYPSVGAAIEKQWPFVTLQLNATYANPSADAVARMKSTASNVPADQRGYYIGVEEVMFNGKNYEYMWIPDGTKFRTDVETLLGEIKALITPFHLGGGGVHFSPWVHFGIYGGFASYEIDAGPPEGIVYYEVPPKAYVKKGKGTGSAGLAIPQIGAGGELRFDFGSRENRPASLVIKGDVGWMHLSGSPGQVGLNVETTREVDFNWLNVKGDVFLEFPLTRTVDFLVGASYRSIRTDVTLDSIHRSEEEQDLLSEKYDKYAEFRFSQLTANIGLRF
jgi:hypothetical protein